MRLLNKMRKQQAVYWAPLEVNDSGEPKLGLPVQIRVRWEDELEEGLDNTGTETIFMSTVYTGEDVKEGGMLFFGTLNDLKKALPPPENAHRIRKFTKTPILNAKEWLREVKL